MRSRRDQHQTTSRDAKKADTARPRNKERGWDEEGEGERERERLADTAIRPEIHQPVNNCSTKNGYSSRISGKRNTLHVADHSGYFEAKIIATISRYTASAKTALCEYSCHFFTCRTGEVRDERRRRLALNRRYSSRMWCQYSVDIM